MNLAKMTDLDLYHKRVIIREDFNVPIKNGIITSDQRLRAALPTIKAALDANAAVIVLSHLGRPEEGKADPHYSLQPVADYLSKALKIPVHFVTDYINGVHAAPGELTLCENVRFNVGEKSSETKLAKKLAALCDIFVMDAFGTAHRAQASTYGIAKYAPIAVAGPLLIKELEALHQVLKAPKKTHYCHCWRI